MPSSRPLSVRTFSFVGGPSHCAEPAEIAVFVGVDRHVGQAVLRRVLEAELKLIRAREPRREFASVREQERSVFVGGDVAVAEDFDGDRLRPLHDEPPFVADRERDRTPRTSDDAKPFVAGALILHHEVERVPRLRLARERLGET